MDILSTEEHAAKLANLLYSVAFFNIFSSEELFEVVREKNLIRLIDFQPEDRVITQGEYDRNFFILLRGNIELRRQADTDEEEVVGSIKKGEVFGEMVITDPTSPRRASAYVTGKIPGVTARINALVVENAQPILKVKFFKKFLDLILDRIDNDERKLHYLCEIIKFAHGDESDADDFFKYSIETAINERNRLTQHIKYTDYLVSQVLQPENSETCLRELLETANKELNDFFYST